MGSAFEGSTEVTDTYPDGRPLLSADAALLQIRRDIRDRAEEQYKNTWFNICGADCPDCDEGLVTLHDDAPADEAQAPTVGTCARCHGRGKIDPKSGD